MAVNNFYVESNYCFMKVPQKNIGTKKLSSPHTFRTTTENTP